MAFAAAAVSVDIQRSEKEFYTLLLVMVAGILGAFVSQDLFLLYFFHELALVPTFIMIGVWGRGEGRNYVTFKITIYLTTRYAGVAHFGKIFGLISSLMGLAGGFGPLIGGIIFDTTGSYTALLLLAIPVAFAAGLSVAGLGPYPTFPPIQRSDSGAAAD